jgi:hypothetical protein
MENNFKRKRKEEMSVDKFLHMVKNLTKKRTERWNHSIGCLIDGSIGGNNTGCVCLNRLTVYVPACKSRPWSGVRQSNLFKPENMV